MPKIDFWYEFASTYSYLAAMRIEALAAKTGVEVVWRPFLLGPIFHAQGWDTSPFNIYPHKGRYMWRDMERLCADEGLPFRRPSAFPRNGLLAARIALIGLRRGEGQGWGAAFSRAVFQAEFAEDADIADPTVLARLIETLGLGIDIAEVLEAAGATDNKNALKAQTAKAEALGLFGAPTFVTADGEIFWGNDRLLSALVWAVKHDR